MISAISDIFMSKKEIKVVERLRKIIEKKIKEKQYEDALRAISVCGEIFYSHNQTYTDDFLENNLLLISRELSKNKGKKSREKCLNDKKTILFYDGFGLDTRGLALIFLKALVELGYDVVYVTKEDAKDRQPRIHQVASESSMKWVYIPTDKSYLEWIESLSQAFELYSPDVSFFYTTPYDVSAVVVFNMYKGATVRYQIDLTDHAFWLGKNAFDYCIALRDLGAKIAYHYRGIPKEKLVMLPYYATVDHKAPFEGFPFDTNGYRVVFSGGSLYKTLGDKEKKYYKIVEHILEYHEDIIFLYAGNGDDSELKKIERKYQGRAYHIAERKDLYQVMKNCVLYLNTYPMFGGLMMNYAATAGKLPITLKHNHDADGLLFNQSKLKIEYDDIESLLKDVDLLLDDSGYLKERENLLKGSVITEKKFKYELKNLIENHRTSYQFDLNYVDTSEFRREFDKRFDLYKMVSIILYRKNNNKLIKNFSGLYWIGKYKCVKENLKKKLDERGKKNDKF